MKQKSKVSLHNKNSPYKIDECKITANKIDGRKITANKIDGCIQQAK